MHHVTFVEGGSGPVAVAHVQPLELLDEDRGRRSRVELERLLGGTPVVQRCAIGDAVVFGGPAYLHRYAADPALGALPTLTIATGSAALKAA